MDTPEQPIVWAGRRAGMAHMRRVYGPDLMPAVCALAAERGWSCFFYGAAEGVPELLAERLAARFPPAIVRRPPRIMNDAPVREARVD